MIVGNSDREQIQNTITIIKVKTVRNKIISNTNLLLHQVTEHINRERENNGRILFRADGCEGLKITELHSVG